MYARCPHEKPNNKINHHTTWFHKSCLYSLLLFHVHWLSWLQFLKFLSIKSVMQLCLVCCSQLLLLTFTAKLIPMHMVTYTFLYKTAEYIYMYVTLLYKNYFSHFLVFIPSISYSWMAILYLQIALVWEGFCLETEWAKYTSLFLTGNKIMR